MLINGNMVLGSTLLYRASSMATVTYDLTNCTSSNQQGTIRANSSYTTNLIASTTFTYCGAQVFMGGQDITLDCYDISTGTITINRVTGNIIIKGESIHEFSNASWFVIKNVAQNNFASNVGWAIGDTKQIVIGTNSYNVRICDMTQERYEYYSDATRKSNMVFECAELYVTNYARHTSAGTGNYAQNSLNTTYLEQIIPNLPSDLASLLEMVKIRNIYYTGVSSYSTSYSNAKLFPPSCKEIGTSFGGSPDTTYEYYSEYGISAKMKKRVGQTDYQQWWLRDGCWWEDTSYKELDGQVGCAIESSGSVFTGGSGYAEYYNSSLSVDKTKGVPLFWAW